MQLSNKKILVIENNPIEARATEIFLHNCGYSEVTLAVSDEEALQTSRVQFDLILLDREILFPSGIELYKKIKLKNQSAPIIVYSILSKEEYKKCREAGIEAFLPKSTLFSDFKCVIQRYLESS